MKISLPIGLLALTLSACSSSVTPIITGSVSIALPGIGSARSITGSEASALTDTYDILLYKPTANVVEGTTYFKTSAGNNDTTVLLDQIPAGNYKILVLAGKSISDIGIEGCFNRAILLGCGETTVNIIGGSNTEATITLTGIEIGTIDTGSNTLNIGEQYSYRVRGNLGSTAIHTILGIKDTGYNSYPVYGQSVSGAFDVFIGPHSGLQSSGDVIVGYDTSSLGSDIFISDNVAVFNIHSLPHYWGAPMVNSIPEIDSYFPIQIIHFANIAGPGGVSLGIVWG